jgi:hypothetical protein
MFKANYVKYREGYPLARAFSKALADVEAEMGVVLSFSPEGAEAVVHVRYPGGAFVESVPEPMGWEAKLKLTELAFARSAVRVIRDKKTL